MSRISAAGGERTVALGRRRLRIVQGAIGVLALIVLVFAAHRAIVDIPHFFAGTKPSEEYDRRFVEHAWLTGLHIAPGALYLVGAPLQLAYRFRSRHYDIHRRLGRVLLTAGLLSGAMAIVVGIVFAFGGVGETVAAVIFGAWFVICLLLAFRAIRQDRVVDHRRWMIRAFATGLAVGTIRIWVEILSVTGIYDFRDSFDVAFWLAFIMHGIAAEWWIRTTPHPAG